MIEETLPAYLTDLEKKILGKSSEIEAWLRIKWRSHVPPFYGSVDLRNSGYKIAPVDMNLFPGGFNNLNLAFISGATIAAQEAMNRLCPDAKTVLIIPENHTRNLFYLENLYALYQILEKAGFQVRIGTLNQEINTPTVLETASAHKITVEPIKRRGGKLYLGKQFEPCAVLLNNDLSAGIPSLITGLDQKITPPTQASWTIRTKTQHFHYYNQVINELSPMIDLDPWLLNPYFDIATGIDFTQKNDNSMLADKVEALLQKISKKYQEYDIKDPPFLIMKADSGTYGMGVMTVSSPDTVRDLNRKNRNKMATIKEGLKVRNVILQEGVYSAEAIAGAVAEPVVYMIDRFVIGGFYRAHEGRKRNENLNAHGMKFIPLEEDISTVPDNNGYGLHHHFTQWPTVGLRALHENNAYEANRLYIYGLIARLSLLASALELENAP